TANPWQGAVALLVPYLFNQLGRPIVPGLDGHSVTPYLGLMPVMLALLVRRGRLALFFGAYATVSVLKVYGAPGINWLGALPILDRAIFPKYNQPVVAFCIAGLAALAVDRLARQPSYAPSVKRVVWTALATMSTIAFFVAYHWSF